MKAKLTIEYHGADFHGWQRQEGVPTVQSILENAVSTFLISQAKKLSCPAPERVVITASGRTDQGVHARGQVVSFAWPEQIPFDSNRLILAINGITPPSLAVLSAKSEEDHFDARHSPHTKQYSYHFLLQQQDSPLAKDRVYRVSPHLDIQAMIRASHLFRGNLDFRCFQRSDCLAKTTFRTIYSSELTRLDSHLLVFSIHGKGFLKYMVRSMAGTILKVGKGLMAVEEVQQMIEEKDHSKVGETLPPYALFLDWVRYDSVTDYGEEEDCE